MEKEKIELKADILKSRLSHLLNSDTESLMAVFNSPSELMKRLGIYGGGEPQHAVKEGPISKCDECDEVTIDKVYSFIDKILKIEYTLVAFNIYMTSDLNLVRIMDGEEEFFGSDRYEITAVEDSTDFILSVGDSIIVHENDCIVAGFKFLEGDIIALVEASEKESQPEEKDPILITEDGKSIYEDDEYFVVYTSGVKVGEIVDSESPGTPGDILNFASYDAAFEVSLTYKRLLSIDDISNMAGETPGCGFYAACRQLVMEREVPKG